MHKKNKTKNNNQILGNETKIEKALLINDIVIENDKKSSNKKYQKTVNKVNKNNYKIKL